LFRSDDIGILTLRVHTLSYSFKSSSTWLKFQRKYMQVRNIISKERETDRERESKRKQSPWP
jgi:hypothetical protein